MSEWYRDWVTLLRKLQHLLRNSNAPIAVSDGMQAVTLCSNKILQFLKDLECQLTYVVLYNGRKMDVL